jgi:hypothetical protein
MRGNNAQKQHTIVQNYCIKRWKASLSDEFSYVRDHSITHDSVLYGVVLYYRECVDPNWAMEVIITKELK